jgi:hypothetical protein
MRATANIGYNAARSVIALAKRPQAQEWANYSCHDTPRVQEVTSTAAQRQKANQLEYRPGDDSYCARCEIGIGNPSKSGSPLFQEGDDHWISFQVPLSDDYPNDTPMWNVLFQIPRQGDGGCPPTALGITGGHMKLFKSACGTYVPGTRQMWIGPAVRNHRVKSTVHLLSATDGNTRFVELFGDLDGTGQKLRTPQGRGFRS